MNNLFNYQGERQFLSNDFGFVVKSVAHRGLSSVAPENTLPAYKAAKDKGFYYVECDVSFTSDGVAVLLHDSTIDRTSDGTGNINSLTYQQVSQYDFGLWKGAEYAGTKIPTLVEFCSLCRKLGLHPYIEIKSSATYSETQIQGIVDIAYKCGLKGRCTFISGTATYLGYVKSYDTAARLGYVAGWSSLDASAVLSTCANLQTDKNEVFADIYSIRITNSVVESFSAADIPIEVWTVDNVSDIIASNDYITGITSDELIASNILCDYALSN